MKSRQPYWSDSMKCGADERNFALHFLESSWDISGFLVIFFMAEWNYGSNIVYHLSIRFWTLFHGTIIFLSAFSKLHAVTHWGNPKVSFHTIIRLWLANKKTSSIREEQMVWQLQAGTPKISHVSLELRTVDFYSCPGHRPWARLIVCVGFFFCIRFPPLENGQIAQ